MEASEVRDECSSLASILVHVAFAWLSIGPDCPTFRQHKGEMQYMDNVLLMMLEQEVADLKVRAEDEDWKTNDIEFCRRMTTGSCRGTNGRSGHCRFRSAVKKSVSQMSC